jgi:gas vesicle protein
MNAVDMMTKEAREAKSAAEHAVSSAEHAAAHAAGAARTGVLDAVSKIAHVYGVIRSFGIDDMLSKAGLSRERTMLGSTARFASGFAVGVGATLLLAPTSGKQLRGQLGRSISRFFAPLEQKVEKAVEKAVDKADTVATKVTEQAYDSGYKAQEIGHTVKEAIKDKVQELGHVVDGKSNASKDKLC